MEIKFVKKSGKTTISVTSMVLTREFDQHEMVKKLVNVLPNIERTVSISLDTTGPGRPLGSKTKNSLKQSLTNKQRKRKGLPLVGRPKKK